MESVFPGLFFLSYFAPVFLRIGVAIAFLLVLKHLYKERADLAHTHFPIFGKPGTLLINLKLGIWAIVTLCFAFGFYTQIAAIIGFIGSFAMLYFSKHYSKFFPYDAITYILLALMCLTLLFTGPGGLAFDLPY